MQSYIKNDDVKDATTPDDALVNSSSMDSVLTTNTILRDNSQDDLIENSLEQNVKKVRNFLNGKWLKFFFK